MLEIEYFGGNCVKITRDKQAIVIDPKRSVFGLQDLDVSGMIEMATEDRLATLSESSFLSINGPGEYEVANFSVRGYAANRMLDGGSGLASTFYVIRTGDVRIGLLGNIDADLSDQQLEKLGVVDILILPVGGMGYTLDAKQAVTLVKRIDPKVVLPIHFADKKLKYEVIQDELQQFAKEIGTTIEKIEKYRLKKLEDLPSNLTSYELSLKY